MHRFHTDPNAGSAPETAGLTIHWASRYDLLSRFLGLGVDSRGSRMIVELAKIMAGDKVLDVGCGTGALTLTAARQAGPAGDVMGIDASPQMIAVARQKAAHSGSGAVFEVGLVERVAYPEASFDVVISRLVIHHLPDDLKRLAFGEIFRVLKPGGRVFLADFAPPSNPILAHLAMALVGHRMMHSTMSGIPAALSATGFVDVASGPTQSAFLAFASGTKPAA